MGCSGTSIMDEKGRNEKNSNLKRDEEEEVPEREVDQKQDQNRESEPMGDFDYIEEDEEIIYNLNLHILIKNLESKNIEQEKIQNSIKEQFNNIKEEEIKKDEIIEKITNIFIEYLKPINNKNIEKIKNIMISIYENSQKPKDFKNFLIDGLENINNYKKIKVEEKNKIDNFIIKSLQKNEKIKNKREELKNKYKKDNYIINYIDFTKIVKENNIEMDKLIFEYLLYKMKCGLSLDGNLSLDNLNFKVFIDFLDKIEDENDLKEEKSIIDKNKENIGINLKS